jgi:hypothetical protein
VNVTVTTPAGTTNGLAYIYSPSINSLSPSQGPAAGGTVITITGVGLTGATGVSFGGTPGTAITPDLSTPDTKLTVTAPAGVAGAATVTVTTATGTSNGLVYTYQ